MNTYEFSCTVEALPGAERLKTIVRSVTSICIDSNSLFNGTVLVRHDAVFNGSGDLRHINFAVKVWDIDYPTAQLVKQVLENIDLHCSLTQEDIPSDYETFGMFTTEGADRVRKYLDATDTALRKGSLSPVVLEADVEVFREQMAQLGHGEVYDTAVREQIWEHLDYTLDGLGIQLTRA